MLHLADRFVVLMLAELLQAPMLVHPRMKEILVDGSQLVLQLLVQVFQSFYVALHGDSLCGPLLSFGFLKHNCWSLKSQVAERSFCWRFAMFRVFVLPK